MKLSDYVADFLAKKGIKHVFAIAGGASLHLIDSIVQHPDITCVCPHHEQASAMAAEAYARVTGNLGVAIATSGPGATNMITGICCAYYDSVPALYITGQVTTFREKGDTGVRQIGFQETETIPMVQSITNYAVKINDSKQIRYELEKAWHLATSGRPGPVLIDLPDNLQREEIEPDDLEAYEPEMPSLGDWDIQLDALIALIQQAHRPVLILGWGVRLSKAEREVYKLIDKLKFPVVPTWAVADILPSDDPLYVGTFGTHGTRYANLTVQNADLILSIGSRLDTKATGSPITTFAREAKKVVVDIDTAELNKFAKFDLHVDLLIQCDANLFAKGLNEKILDTDTRDYSKWVNRIGIWKKKYPICPEAYYSQKGVNPYVFVKSLANVCVEGDTLFVDTGCAVAWMMQAFEFKKKQRLFHDCNNTAMGWALPAGIAASLALDKKPVICVIGDGSLMMNIQELVTVINLGLPLKIFVLSNSGYSMIQQTQDQWLDSRYAASSLEGGLAFPDFVKVAKAHEFQTFSIAGNQNLQNQIEAAIHTDGPVFCNIEIDSSHRVIPLVKFGRPNEDTSPLLDRAEFLKDMIVKPLEVSLGELSK